MEVSQNLEPQVEKPVIIAAMQDMGNVGSIVVSFLNEKLKTEKFRQVKSSYPAYVLDKGGYIETPEEEWQYRYAEDIIIFGGGMGQPQDFEELHSLCQDVIDVSKKYSAKFIYTVGGFHTDKKIDKEPNTYVTTTSKQLAAQMHDLGINTTPQQSMITGFNGLILGYAKNNGLHGIGLYGELNEPQIPQYRAATAIIKTLEKLTYRKFGSTEELEILAKDIDDKLGRHSGAF